MKKAIENISEVYRKGFCLTFKCALIIVAQMLHKKIQCLKCLLHRNCNAQYTLFLSKQFISGFFNKSGFLNMSCSPETPIKEASSWCYSMLMLIVMERFSKDEY